MPFLWSNVKNKLNWPLQIEIPKHTITVFVCYPKILHKHCFQFLLGPFYGGPNLFICPLVMFLNRVFRQKNRFLWFLASLIKNGQTLRNCYLFSCRFKNVWNIGICLKPHFYKKCQYFRNPKTDFSLTSANKPQTSLVLYLQVWSQSWPKNSMHK